jgi:hypothetical protein
LKKDYNIPIDLGLSRSPGGFFKPLPEPGCDIDSETAALRFLKWKWPLHNRFKIEMVTNL